MLAIPLDTRIAMVAWLDREARRRSTRQEGTIEVQGYLMHVA